MAGRISDEDIERARSAVDIVEVIGGFVPLKKSGRSFKGLCPFHAEKTPSFHVFPESQLFKCFGCGKAGNVFGFLMAQEKLPFHEAVRSVADRAGLVLREDEGAARASGERDALLAALRAAAHHFRGNLVSPAGARAREYLSGRGIGEALVDRFFLGFALPEWDGLLRALRGQFPEEALETAGLAVASSKGGRYDRFRDRIVFPIADVRGRAVGFGARAMPGAPADAPKYVNSPETPVYRKSQVLYGLHLAREENLQEQGVVIVEGYTDVILLHGAGVRNACAACGTALTPEHVRLLKRYTDRLHLVFDGDEAGVHAMDRGLELLAGEEVDLTLTVLPGGEDPADFVARAGAEAFREALKGGRDLCDFKLAMLEAREDLSTAGGMARAADAMLALVRKVRHPVRRGEFLRRIAERLRTSEEALRARLEQGDRPGGPGRAPAPPAPPDARARQEGMLLEALLGDPALAERARAEWPPERVRDAALRAAMEKVLGICEGAGRPALTQLIEGEPQGAMAEVAERILDREQRELVVDFRALWEGAVQALEALERRAKREEIKRALRDPGTEADPERRREMLRSLHRTC